MSVVFDKAWATTDIRAGDAVTIVRDAKGDAQVTVWSEEDGQPHGTAVDDIRTGPCRIQYELGNTMVRKPSL